MHIFNRDDWKPLVKEKPHPESRRAEEDCGFPSKQSTQQFEKCGPSECPKQAHNSSSNVVIPGLQAPCVMKMYIKKTN